MKRSLLFIIGLGLFVTTSQGEDEDMNSGVLLLPTPGVKSTVRFSETLKESLKIRRYREEGEWFRDVEERVKGRSAFKVTGTLGGVDPTTITDESEIGISIGNFSQYSTVGERSGGSIEARRVVFHAVEEIFDDEEGGEPRLRRIGTITYRWNATSFTISANFRLAVGNVVSGDLAQNEEPGRSRYSDQIRCNVKLNGEESSRRVHASGRVRVIRQRVGSEEDGEEYFLATVSARGSADYKIPKVKIDQPRSGSRVSLEDEDGVAVSGSASDDRVLHSVLVRLNGGEWMESELLFKLLGLDEDDGEIFSIKSAKWQSVLDTTVGGGEEEEEEEEEVGSPLEGEVTLETQAVDLDGNRSKIAKRTFILPSAL